MVILFRQPSTGQLGQISLADIVTRPWPPPLPPHLPLPRPLLGLSLQRGLGEEEAARQRLEAAGPRHHGRVALPRPQHGLPSLPHYLHCVDI